MSHHADAKRGTPKYVSVGLQELKDDDGQAKYRTAMAQKLKDAQVWMN